MCAIFGYIAKAKRKFPIRALEAIINGNACRGPHAFGLSWISEGGRLMSYRQCGNFVDSLGMLAMARDAKMLIGHLRYATHGKPQRNINNHPHPCDGGWIVHNGVVTNYRALLESRDLWPSSECDSEVIGQIVERADGTFKGRMSEAARACTGSMAVMGLWARPARMLVMRSGNPLHTSETGAGRFFATLAEGLPGGPELLESDTVFEHVLGADGKLAATREETGRDLPPSNGRDSLPVAAGCRPRGGEGTGPINPYVGVPRGLLFDASEYKGG